jgi:hypothetical protein
MTSSSKFSADRPAKIGHLAVFRQNHGSAGQSNHDPGKDGLSPIATVLTAACAKLERETKKGRTNAALLKDCWSPLS